MTKKKLPGKMTMQYNGATFLTWERVYVPQHRAHFYQLLALDDQPFHFYVVTPKGSFALNMAKFVHKIDIAIADVKEKLAKEYNLTPEEMDRIIEKRKDNLDRQLASISKETGRVIAEETSKAVESEVASAVDTQLAKELEAAVGAAVAEEFISAIEQASGQTIDRAISGELASAIDQAIAEAVSEGISAAAAEAGIRAGLAVLAAGGTEQEATDACSAAAGTSC